MHIIIISIFTILFALFHIIFEHQPIIESFLLATIIFNIGVVGIIGFIAHFFFPNFTAKRIGWPTGNPFQKEVSYMNLGLGVAGILSFWWHGDFWTATVVINAIIMYTCGLGHIYDLVVHKNRSPYNTGIILWHDLFIPIFTVLLLIFYKLN